MRTLQAALAMHQWHTLVRSSDTEVAQWVRVAGLILANFVKLSIQCVDYYDPRMG